MGPIPEPTKRFRDQLRDLAVWVIQTVGSTPRRSMKQPKNSLSQRLISRGDYQKLFEDYDWACRYCRKSIPDHDSATLDHRIPKWRGGSDRLRNLVLCCIDCNVEKGSMTEYEYVWFRENRPDLIRSAQEFLNLIARKLSRENDNRVDKRKTPRKKITNIDLTHFKWFVQVCAFYDEKKSRFLTRGDLPFIRRERRKTTNAVTINPV